MPRGGKRQGTPGKGYANRTDLAMQPDMDKNTAAAGGMEPPTTDRPQFSGPSPDDIPSIGTPTQRPGEPITAGLDMGAGPGRDALTGFDPRAQETARLAQKWGPMMDVLTSNPDTPDSVRILARYIKGFR